MTSYPIQTVSRPYRYKKKEKQTQKVDVEAEQTNTNKKNPKQKSFRANQTDIVPAEASSGLGMKASRLLTRQEQWQRRYPEKRRAHEAVRHALARGSLVRQPCEECGATQHVDAHHEDYAQPLAITWLCRRHHAARHRRTITKGPKP